MGRRRDRTEGWPPFRDRSHAGAVLAEQVAAEPAGPDPVVLALPRGGVPVAAPVAARLAAPLGVIVVRKLGAPGRPELAMGALALVGDRVQEVRNDDVADAIGVSAEVFGQTRAREEAILRARADQFGARPVPVAGRTVVVVDDGLATGSTMTAAVSAVRHLEPAAVVVAVPVGAGPAVAALGRIADRVACLWTPADFVAVGQYYRDFTQTTNEEVVALLAAAG